MGKLERRFIKTKQLEAGTWATPLSIYTPSQIACQFVHNVFTPGTAEGGLFGVQGSITSGNLTLKGVHARATVLTTKNLGTGSVYGIHVETEALGTGIIGGTMEGIDVETYVESTATITGDHYGIYVKTYSDIAGSKQIFPLRLEHNGVSVAEAFIGVYCQTTKMTYLLESSNTDELWCAVTGTLSVGAGWLRVKLGGYVRYIPLYSS